MESGPVQIGPRKGAAIMRSVVPMRLAKTGYIVLSALFCVLGAVLFFLPGSFVPWIGRAMGVGMILFGAVKLVGYFSRDLYRLAFQYDLAFGILFLALGAVGLAWPEGTMSFFCVLLGIPVLADGLFKIQIAIDSRRFGIRSWLLILIVAVLTGAVGAVMVFLPDAGTRLLTMLLGLALFLDGALNLCVAICTVKIVPHQKPDTTEAIDVEYREIGKD